MELTGTNATFSSSISPYIEVEPYNKMYAFKVCPLTCNVEGKQTGTFTFTREEKCLDTLTKSYNV